MTDPATPAEQEPRDIPREAAAFDAVTTDDSQNEPPDFDVDDGVDVAEQEPAGLSLSVEEATKLIETRMRNWQDVPTVKVPFAWFHHAALAFLELVQQLSSAKAELEQAEEENKQLRVLLDEVGMARAATAGQMVAAEKLLTQAERRIEELERALEQAINVYPMVQQLPKVAALYPEEDSDEE